MHRILYESFQLLPESVMAMVEIDLLHRCAGTLNFIGYFLSTREDSTVIRMSRICNTCKKMDFLAGRSPRVHWRLFWSCRWYILGRRGRVEHSNRIDFTRIDGATLMAFDNGISRDCFRDRSNEKNCRLLLVADIIRRAVFRTQLPDRLCPQRDQTCGKLRNALYRRGANKRLGSP